MNASAKDRQAALASLYPTWELRTLDQALTHAARQCQTTNLLFPRSAAIAIERLMPDRCRYDR